MKKRILFVLVIISSILFCGCGPSEKAVQEAISKTSTAEASLVVPTATPTTFPFSALNLEEILVKEGDLPAGFEPAQIRTRPSDLSKSAPEPDYLITQTFSHNNSFGGILDVLVYEDEENVSTAYESIVSNVPHGSDPKDVAFGSYGQSSWTMGFVTASTVVFVRCNSVVMIQIDTIDEGSVLSYAERLDERLIEYVCR